MPSSVTSYADVPEMHCEEGIDAGSPLGAEMSVNVPVSALQRYAIRFSMSDTATNLPLSETFPTSPRLSMVNTWVAAEATRGAPVARTDAKSNF